MGRVRHRDAMVAARGGDHASRWHLAQEQIGEGAARFECARVLQLLELERQVECWQAEVGARDRDDGGAADVRANTRVRRLDALTVNQRELALQRREILLLKEKQNSRR